MQHTYLAFHKEGDAKTLIALASKNYKVFRKSILTQTNIRVPVKKGVGLRSVRTTKQKGTALQSGTGEELLLL